MAALGWYVWMLWGGEMGVGKVWIQENEKENPKGEKC